MEELLRLYIDISDNLDLCFYDADKYDEPNHLQ